MKGNVQPWTKFKTGTVAKIKSMHKQYDINGYCNVMS